MRRTPLALAAWQSSTRRQARHGPIGRASHPHRNGRCLPWPQRRAAFLVPPPMRRRQHGPLLVTCPCVPWRSTAWRALAAPALRWPGDGRPTTACLEWPCRRRSASRCRFCSGLGPAQGTCPSPPPTSLRSMRTGRTLRAAMKRCRWSAPRLHSSLHLSPRSPPRPPGRLQARPSRLPPRTPSAGGRQAPRPAVSTTLLRCQTPHLGTPSPHLGTPSPCRWHACATQPAATP